MTPPITLDGDAVEKLLPQIDFVAELRRMFAELGREQAVQPPQTLTLFPDNLGDFITYLGAWVGEGVFGGKLSPYLVTQDKPVITAWTLLMSMKTGQPLLLCDSGALTTERTAATTALAVDLLAKPDAAQLAIVGAGPIAQAHWRHVSGLRDWQAVRVHSPSLAQDAEKQAAWRALCPKVTFTASAEDAAAVADVVMLCTSSGTPVVDHKSLRPDVLVTSTASNAPKAREIDPGFLPGAQVYCDYRKTTPFVAGDMVLAAETGSWSVEKILGDLPELCSGNATTPKAGIPKTGVPKTGVPKTGTPIFFRSIGLGLEDIAAATALYKAAR